MFLLAENCGNGVKLDCVKEGPRTFLIIRGRDKKSCIDGFNKIIKARNLLEQLPGLPFYLVYLVQWEWVICKWKLNKTGITISISSESQKQSWNCKQTKLIIKKKFVRAKKKIVNLLFFSTLKRML